MTFGLRGNLDKQVMNDYCLLPNILVKHGGDRYVISLIWLQDRNGSVVTTVSRGKAVLDSDSTTGSLSDEQGSRMNWSNTYEFLFTCLLYVVGLGNIVRFPTLAYTNGGGK